MSNKTFYLKIITPEAITFHDNVQQVTLPGGSGEMTILPDHANLLSTLNIGPVYIVDKQGDHLDLALSGGYVDINENIVTILAETAEKAELIDEQRAQKARERAQQLIEEGSADRDQALVAASLQRSLARLKVIERYRRKRKRS